MGQAEWAENATLYARAAAIQALRGDVGEAIRLLEAGRARGLAQAQTRRHADLNVLSVAEREEYAAAVNMVLEIEAHGRQSGDYRHALALVNQAEAANATLAAVVSRLQQAHPEFLPEHGPTPQALATGLRHAEVLIYLAPQSNGTLLVAIPQAGEPRAEWFGKLTEDQLFNLAVQPDRQGNNRLGYLPAAVGWGPTPLDEALDALLPALGERLMRRVVQLTHELGARRAVLVPGGLLAVLPLHAATYKPLASEDQPTAGGGRRYACDDLAITYTPSGAAYLASRTALERLGPLQRSFVVGNPHLTPAQEPWEPGMDGYLPFAEREAIIVAGLMRTAGLDVNCKLTAEATWRAVMDGLRNADLAHLSMHAVFNSDDPLASALLVAPRARLFLRDLLDPQLVSLAHLRLAVLSTCQSGLGDFQRLREEALGLFGALLAAGAVGVVGSLWPVYDASTAVLMEALTRRYLQEGQEPDAALRNAMRELRGLPDEILAEHTEPSRSTGLEALGNQRTAAQRSWEALRARTPAAVRQLRPRANDGVGDTAAIQRRAPLTHPIHWAPFVYYGT